MAAAAAVLLLAFGPAQAQVAQAQEAQEERITAFESDVTVAADGALEVVETIAVVSDGDQIRRGIFRDFPTRSLIPPGFNHIAGFEVEGVERDGAPEPWFAEPLDAGVRVYIGDASRLLRDGPHRYRLAYRSDRQLLQRDAEGEDAGEDGGEDELYWNVTGDAWAFPIERATVTLHLPEGARALRVAGYTGRPGESGDAFRLLEDRPGLVRLETTRRLAPGEGFTVAVAWPAGAVSRPDAGEAAWLFVRDNPGPLLGWLLTLVLLAYFLVAWHRLGRDPEPGTVYPQFDPPEGLSAVGAGYVWHEGFGSDFPSSRALTVALTGLATKGALTIGEAGRDALSIERTKTESRPLTRGETAVLGALFPEGADDSLQFGKTYQPRMGKASDALMAAFGSEFSRVFFRSNSRLWLLGAGLALIAVLAALLPEARTEDTLVMTLFLLPFGTAVLAAAVGFALSAFGRATAGRPGRTLLRLAIAAGCLLPILALLLFAGDVVAPMAVLPAALAIGATLVFWTLLKAPTRLGRQTLDALAGYRLYLSVAEGDRLEMAGREPRITEALYEEHLPYAMALGVEQAWSERLEAELARSGRDPSAARSSYRPQWYHRSWSSGDGPGSLASALSRNLGGAAATAATRPSSRSGGSSGGGSSGGGGGGGGGGGW